MPTRAPPMLPSLRPPILASARPPSLHRMAREPQRCAQSGYFRRPPQVLPSQQSLFQPSRAARHLILSNEITEYNPNDRLKTQDAGLQFTLLPKVEHGERACGHGSSSRVEGAEVASSEGEDADQSVDSQCPSAPPSPPAPSLPQSSLRDKWKITQMKSQSHDIFGTDDEDVCTYNSFATTRRRRIEQLFNLRMKRRALEAARHSHRGSVAREPSRTMRRYQTFKARAVPAWAIFIERLKENAKSQMMLLSLANADRKEGLVTISQCVQIFWCDVLCALMSYEP